MTRSTVACRGLEASRFWSRRELLSVGAAGALGLALPDLLRAREQVVSPRSSTFGRARSVIILYLHGGHAQQETWDPKPDGPSPERGEFGAIATSVPGTFVSELLPRSARIMHKLAVIRSLSHGNANHVQASLDAMTGHSHPPSTESRGDFPPLAERLSAIRRRAQPAAAVRAAADVGASRPAHAPQQRHGAARPASRFPRAALQSARRRSGSVAARCAR